ncbi:MAG: hypothetical protein Q4D60_02205 [Eubacteriales bacterium]|nr:hypothetical protein [Eubacteriales bacterium]
MKKSKCIFMTVVAAGAVAGLVFLFRFLQNHFDDCKEGNLFEEDLDLDFLDEEEEDTPLEAPAKEEKAPKQKVRRGYIPIKLHSA